MYKYFRAVCIGSSLTSLMSAALSLRLKIILSASSKSSSHLCSVGQSSTADLIELSVLLIAETV